MALQCPECGAISHARSSFYEAPSIKRTYYQCKNLECSCTFTALESVDTIIARPNKVETKDETASEQSEKSAQTLGKYGAASRLSNRQQIPV
ncbi:TPA: ogr/Delta-like zinc finger family protein [Klebsiella variicola subsp. variicola]|uniref:ogr/Delta-like zinc finger family protein n=1 Tax=Enterobacteriaceae TaxID=543 RepID=UPI000E2B6B87|nr:ogr/Delta-like zinc finger family protein [Enterobacter hormaechei]VVL47473.1 DNA-binding transcriptional regulator [Klebsiella variicola]HDU5818690.1 ogr/Delta-like zinc finger family protein [Klebsiella quasipneumoniae subsp. similipneumoniae]MCL8082518.1 ogr/Delta-like zinc finger family protein [Enterobacter hormaechei]MCM8484854.1 ogr/Delta-like zinc finger family protein [Enterobacter hormaechei]MDF3718592.1 ogr/Delta-like zinc finger family protein [Enterobacter hormaechei]